MLKKTLKSTLKKGVILFREIAGCMNLGSEEISDCQALLQIYKRLIETGHKRVAGGWLFDGEFYPDYLTMGGASFAIRRTASKHCKGRGLDIGAGFWPLPGSTPIDTEQGPGTAHSIEGVSENSQDYVFSSHCLEHIENWEEALDFWISKLKTHGILFLYLPHPSCKLWHKSNPNMSGIHSWVPTPEIISTALIRLELEIIDRDDGPDHFYSFYICGRRKS